MLSKEENAVITQTGAGTRVGELLRRYWTPALMSRELDKPNGDPVRIELLGESFVAWRDAEGRVGIFDEFCMHRGTSLSLARCEGDGLRCIYHGWKFATDGTILETPNFKDPTVRQKLRAPVYPVREAGGLVWVYLGPADLEPPFPHWEFFDLPAETLTIYHTTFDCNWLQMMETSIDPSHVLILHQDTVGVGYTSTGNGAASVGFVATDLAPACEVEDTVFGCNGVALHDAVTDDGRPAKLAKTHCWVMPYMSIQSTAQNFVIYVPIDDERTTLYGVAAGKNMLVDGEQHLRLVAGSPNYYDGKHYRMGASERWGQDRSKLDVTFTGLEGAGPEDLAVVLSRGRIADRTRENLVPADKLVIRMRRRLLQAARDLEAGTEPFMLTPEQSMAIRADERLLEEESDWHELHAGSDGLRLPGRHGRA
jgi:phenylpropionate dioxygenase-like ring-hydroxylating dioxygenase large terminal subunit